MQNELRGKILWCFKQKKGIKLVKPNENLCNAYLKKSNNALKSMYLNMGSKLYEWAVESAYYARYYSIYALLQKIGIKSEIHDCSIMLIKYLFQNKISLKLTEELEKAKEQRIDLVYYTDKNIPEKEIEDNTNSVSNFLLEIEKIISELQLEEINSLRKNLNKILNVNLQNKFNNQQSNKTTKS